MNERTKEFFQLLVQRFKIEKAELGVEPGNPYDAKDNDYLVGKWSGLDLAQRIVEDWLHQEID
jgi:hypothetical protein